MRCKNCKNEVPDGSIFCNWCGERLVKERKKKDEIKVPKARKLSSGKWNIELRAEGLSITEETEDMCIAKAKAIRSKLIGQKTRPENITLREAIDKYIDASRSRLSPSTIAGYEKIRDNHFQDIMDKKLSALTPAVLDDAVRSECERKSRRGGTLSAKTVKNAWFLVVTTLEKYAPGTDASKVRLPEVKRAIPTILTPEQIIPIIKGTNIELPCLLAMWLSLSMSEILGLTKSKSIVNNQLVIAETVILVNGKNIRKSGGKEENRTRALSIPSYIEELIKKVEGDVIVPMTRNVIYKAFSALLQANNLPHISFHRLRHINASVMAMLNIPEAEANERGGWKTDYTRKRVYTHVFSEQRKKSDEIIDRHFESIIGRS